MEERKGYHFAGWYIDKECTKRINPGGILPHTMSLYDKWIPIYGEQGLYSCKSYTDIYSNTYNRDVVCGIATASTTKNDLILAILYFCFSSSNL